MQLTPDDEKKLQQFYVRGAVVTQNGTSTQNLHEATSYNQQPTEFLMSLKAHPSLLIATKYISQFVNQLTALTCLTDSAGNNRLAVATSSENAIATPSAPAAVSVGVASGVLLAANASRRYAIFVNTSANYVSLAFGGAATLYSGITLNPLGGAYEMSEGAGNLYRGEVRAIASAAASNVGVQESV